AENIGWYDYMYGAAYSLPRVYFNQMDENYKFAKDQGIIGHVAELYPNFAGEGPKAWLASKLQWDPDQDVDALLDDWYVSAVGEDAAPYLREYFEFWEEFWTVRILDFNWFPSLPRVYLDFNNLTYLRELTREELYSQQYLLYAVLENAKTDPQKTRAEYFIEGFEYYETSFLSFPISNEVTVEIPLNEEDALKMMDRVKESYTMAKRRLEIPDEFVPDPILKHYGANRGFLDGIQPKYIEALEAYVAENEPDGGTVSEQLNPFLSEIGYKVIQANAYRTEASKEEIMESLDFSQGPWESAVAVDKFYIINSKVEPPAETKVRLLWDDDYIYIGYENFDDDLSKMISGALAGSGFWWASGQDDSNETYITINPDDPFLGFFSNPEGNKFVRPRTIPADYVEGEWDYSASIGDDRWSAIQAIPFNLIGVDDPNEIASLQAIFFRSYHGASAYIGWEGGAPWNPAGFNTVNLVK
ncbi:MAG: DUF4838 domain-containing protein, partial [Clostridiales bacterium]|nr:DUF4838 domain-containing protein [Clostridiales bacterium]